VFTEHAFVSCTTFSCCQVVSTGYEVVFIGYQMQFRSGYEYVSI
jgi:hypothetical protein